MNINTQKKLKLGINNKEFTLKKLPIIKIANLFKAYEDLPQQVKSKLLTIDVPTEKAETQNLVNQILVILPDIANLFILCMNTDSKELTADCVLNEFGIDDISIIIETIFEINGVETVIGTIKKMQALTGQKTAQVLS